MYIPKHFEVGQWEEIIGFVARARAADLVTVSSTGVPVATLMPCMWDTSNIDETNYGTLVMHMARANPQWKSIEADRAEPWSTSEAEPKYFDAQLRGRSWDRQRVIGDLANSSLSDDHEIAEEMKRTL